MTRYTILYSRSRRCAFGVGGRRFASRERSQRLDVQTHGQSASMGRVLVSPLPSHPSHLFYFKYNCRSRDLFYDTLRLRYYILPIISLATPDVPTSKTSPTAGAAAEPAPPPSRRRQRASLQRSRSPLMHASSRVKMTVGKTCFSAHFCVGHRRFEAYEGFTRSDLYTIQYGTMLAVRSFTGLPTICARHNQ
jgi:hypothetical protein